MSVWGFGSATHGTLAIGTVSGTVLAANPNRRYALFINDSDTVQYLQFGTAAALLNKGIRLAASGGSYEMTREKGNLFTGQVMGISSAAAKTVLITEA